VNAVPSVGCPANGSSESGVKIRTSYPFVRTAVTNVVSENPISFASTDMVTESSPSSGSGTTQTWFPANGTSVNTSTMRNATSTAGSIAVARLAPARV
jgi:hypothetical protein